jgi:hypothetical protein
MNAIGPATCKTPCNLQNVVTLQGFGTTLTVAYHTVEPRYENLFASMRMLVTSGDLRLSVSGARAAVSRNFCQTGRAPMQLQQQLCGYSKPALL